MAKEMTTQMQDQMKNISASYPYNMEEIENIENPSELLKQSLEGLEDYGDFTLIETMADGLDNMNPNNRAAKKIFLQDTEFAEQREQLKTDLLMWLNILDSDVSTASEAVEKSQTSSENAKRNLLQNLGSVHEQTLNLEKAYRTLGEFFANSGQDKLECLNLMNVDKEELGDPEGKVFQKVRDEIRQHYDKISKREAYSILVSPGYLGDKQTVNMWAQMAYRNKVMLVTDYADVTTLKLLNKGLDKANLYDSDRYLSNVIMACNYILGRKKSDADNEEEEDLYLPPSAAIAGRMVNTDEIPISQGIAGKKFGTIDMAKGTRMDLLKSELAALVDKGVIPMTFVDNRVMAFSNRSLYNGATAGMQEYPIVRVYDWISKVIEYYLDMEQTWQLISSNKIREIQQQIIDFLEDIKGPGKLIESYSNVKIIYDRNKPGDLDLQIDLIPFYAARNFHIKLSGQGRQKSIPTEWSNEIS